MRKSSCHPLNVTLLLLLVVCILYTSGCTTLQAVNIAQETGRATLAKGDTIVVTTDDGHMHTFKVVDITTGGIHGKELSIPYSDIRLLQIKRVDTTKTALLILGVIGVGAMVSDGDSGDSGY